MIELVAGLVSGCPSTLALKVISVTPALLVAYVYVFGRTNCPSTYTLTGIFDVSLSTSISNTSGSPV